MTIPSGQARLETPLQRERRIFAEQIARLLNCSVFALTLRGARWRGLAINSLFLLTFVFLVLQTHPLSAWAERLQAVFQAMLNPGSVQGNPMADFLIFSLSALFGPMILQYLPLILLPFFIALIMAARYLADIFELKRVDIAQTFIRQVALTGGYDLLVIRNGRIAQEDEQSPVYLIGGPGQVLVELDSAALFEKPTGQPHVIGPSVEPQNNDENGKKPGRQPTWTGRGAESDKVESAALFGRREGATMLEGFERLRRSYDLHDHVVSISVPSRSLDGIAVSAEDVRMIFSIMRGGQSTTLERPYPVVPKAIEALVYRELSRVSDEEVESSIGEHLRPPEGSPVWPNAMKSLIRRELSAFAAQRPLTEYLAGYGMTEFESAQALREDIRKEKAKFVSDGNQNGSSDPPLPAPHFTPRPEITSLFSQFAAQFTGEAARRGVQLQWIGLGTWKTPSGIIPEQHLEAWRISRENLIRGSQDALKELEYEAGLEQIQRMIQDVPLAAYGELAAKDSKQRMQALLIAYLQQLVEAKDFMENRGMKAPVEIEQAIRKIWALIGHRVSPSAPPQAVPSSPRPPQSRPPTPAPILQAANVPVGGASPSEEETLYRNLRAKVGGDTVLLERLIEYERRRAPRAGRVELLKRAIARWERDNQ